MRSQGCQGRAWWEEVSRLVARGPVHGVFFAPASDPTRRLGPNGRKCLADTWAERERVDRVCDEERVHATEILMCHPASPAETTLGKRQRVEMKDRGDVRVPADALIADSWKASESPAVGAVQRVPRRPLRRVPRRRLQRSGSHYLSPTT